MSKYENFWNDSFLKKIRDNTDKKESDFRYQLFNDILLPGKDLNKMLGDAYLEIYKAGYRQGYTDCLTEEKIKHHTICPCSVDYSGLQESV